MWKQHLVFDPTDSLANAVNSTVPVRLSGIPCEVPGVSRLEKQWYAVRFFTSEDWRNCPSSPPRVNRQQEFIRRLTAVRSPLHSKPLNELYRPLTAARGNELHPQIGLDFKVSDRERARKGTDHRITACARCRSFSAAPVAPTQPARSVR